MINMKILAGGNYHLLQPSQRVIGDQYADDVQISVEKPYEERESVCVMVITHGGAIVDLIPVLSDPFYLKTNVSQYDRIFVSFNFIRPDGTIKNSLPLDLMIMPEDKPEGFTPDTPYMNTLAATINANYNVIATLDGYVLTVTTLSEAPVATVDYEDYITDVDEWLGAKEEERKETDAAILQEAEDYADGAAASALADAKTYADGKDAETLAAAKGYTDTREAYLQAQIDVIAGDLEYDNIFAAMLDDTNTSRIFVDWYKTVKTDGISRFEMLKRFFAMCALNNDQTQTVRFLSPSVSSESRGTPLDALADKKAQNLETDAGAVAGGNSWLDAEGNAQTSGEDWATENRMTWYIRANALSLENGDMNVIAIEGIDDDFDLTGETAPVYTFQMSPYFKEVDDGAYLTKSWRANPADGFAPFNDNIDLNGNPRPLTWHATFCGGLTTSGNKLTSGAGRYPKNYTSAQDGDTAAKRWSNHEGVGVDGHFKWALYEWQRRHFNLENSGVAEGCLFYNYQKQCALGATGKKVILAAADAADYVAGSYVSVGSSNDRSNAASYSITAPVKILSKSEAYEVDGVSYVDLNLDLAADITTTTSAYVNTMPYKTGATEALSGHADGSPVSLTAGKYPLRVAGLEVLIGCYYIGLDVLYNVTGASSPRAYAVYACKDSRRYGSTISSYYTDTGIAFAAMPQGWNFVKKFVITSKPVLFPAAIDGSSTGYVKSSFYGTYSAGVRCPWRGGYLSSEDDGGLACEAGYLAPGNSYWYGAPLLAGAEKKRGELAG